MGARVLGFANVRLGVWEDGGTDSPFYWINVRDPLKGNIGIIWGYYGDILGLYRV